MHAISHNLRRRHILRTGAGLTAATAAMLASTAVAGAQPLSPSTPASRPAAGAVTQRPDSTIRLSTRSTRAGSQITISGDAPRNARAGQYINLESFAFNTKRDVQGVPTIRVQVSAQGTYRLTTVLRQGLKPTTYAVVVNYQGRLVSPTAWLTITPGPDSTVTVSASRVSPGARLTISGDAPTYAPTGRTVTLSSPAFTRPVTTQVSAQGTYQVTAPIRTGLKAGNYTITGSYNGHRFSNTVTITVR